MESFWCLLLHPVGGLSCIVLDYDIFATGGTSLFVPPGYQTKIKSWFLHTLQSSSFQYHTSLESTSSGRHTKMKLFSHQTDKEMVKSGSPEFEFVRLVIMRTHIYIIYQRIYSISPLVRNGVIRIQPEVSKTSRNK